MAQIAGIIKRGHVLQAIEEIDRNDFPLRRRCKLYKLVYNGKNYPSKYTVALAYKYATGRFLDSEEFGGGKQTIKLLTKLGFKVVSVSDK